MASAIDITIIHAWRFLDSFTELEEMLHTAPDFTFRNFGLPWHDPVYQPSTEEGMLYLRNLAEVQVLPAKVVIAIPEMFASERSRLWADIQLAMAKSEGKPVLLVTRNPASIPEWLAKEAVEVVAWDGTLVIDAIRRLASPPRPAP